MKVGPIKNPFSPDCMPLMLDVDEKWLSEQLAANPGVSAAEIILTNLFEGFAKAMSATAKKVAEVNRGMGVADNGTA